MKLPDLSKHTNLLLLLELRVLFKKVVLLLMQEEEECNGTESVVSQ